MTLNHGLTTVALSLLATTSLSADPPHGSDRGFPPRVTFEARSVERLAYDLRREVDRFERKTLDRPGRFATRHGPLRASIYELGDEARHFAAQAAHGHRDPVHTLEDFEYLAGALHQVGAMLSRTWIDRKTRRDFEKVERAFNRLAVHFAPRRVAVHRGARARVAPPVVVRGQIGGPGGTRVAVGVRTRRGHVEVDWNR